MGYICAKKLNLSGKEYHPGEIIPDDAFLGDRARKLKAFDYIAEVGAKGEPSLASCEEPVIAVVFSECEESVAYPVNTEQLQAIADTMRNTAGDAVTAIEDLSDESVLAFIVNVDSRKAVREAAQKRLSALYSTPGPTDQSAPGAAQEGTEGTSGQVRAATTEQGGD